MVKRATSPFSLFCSNFAKHVAGGPLPILGDPGAVSRVGRKGGTEVFRGERALGYRLSPNYFQNFERMTAPDWAQKNALYYCAQSANSFSCGVSSFREFVHDGYCLATRARFVHQACACKGNFYFVLTRNEGTTDESKKSFGMLSAGAIEFDPNIPFLRDHNVS